MKCTEEKVAIRIYVRQRRNIRFSVKIAHFSRIKWRLNENKWKEKIRSVYISRAKEYTTQFSV